MSLNHRVILSAGHGSGDPGAVGQGSTEAIENTQIVDKIAALLHLWGVETIVVPNDVGDLVATINWVNSLYKNLDDGLLVEIHKNSGGGNGTEVWAPSFADPLSTQESQLIADAVAASTGEPNRGVKFAQNNRWGKLGILDDTNTRAVLVECGFIDVNAIDDAADSRYAYGIAKGIMDIFGLGIPEPTPVIVPVPTSPVPAAVKLDIRKTFTAKLSPTNVWDLNTKPDWKSVKQLQVGEIFLAYAVIAFNGSTYYVTEYSFGKGLKQGINAVDLTEVVPPEPVIETPVMVPPIVNQPIPVIPSPDSTPVPTTKPINLYPNWFIAFCVAVGNFISGLLTKKEK